MATLRRILGTGVVVLAMTGCGSAAREAAPPPSVAAPPSPVDRGFAPPQSAPPPPSVVSAAPPAAPAPMTASSQERAPSERPGLGTEWGETVRSEVREVSFERASADPFALVSVHYDDRDGVLALARRHGTWSRETRAVALAGGQVSMSIVGRRGPLEALSADGLVYVAGRAGDRYSIVLANDGERRFEAVVTVDGLDVMNGQSGSLSNRGYVLDAHSRLKIEGFRQSDDTVAAFRFGRVADSYAAQTGSARDVGVIGLALFADRQDESRAEEARFRDGADPFPASDRYARPPR